MSISIRDESSDTAEVSFLAVKIVSPILVVYAETTVNNPLVGRFPEKCNSVPLSHFQS